MGELDAVSEELAPEHDEAAATPAATPSVHDDDLADLFSEWDKAHAPDVAEPQLVENAAPLAGEGRPQTDNPPHTPKGLLDLLKQTNAARDRLVETQSAGAQSIYAVPGGLEMAIKMDTIAAFAETALQGLHAQEMQRREGEDGAAVLAEASRRLEGMDVPEGYVERWLMAEYAANPDVKRAWDNRNRSQDDRDFGSVVIENALRRLVKDARKIPSAIDHEATADRMVISAYMRGGGKAPPPEDSKAYSRRLQNMTDAEFNKHREETYGI